MYRIIYALLLSLFVMPAWAKDITLSLKPKKDKVYHYCVQTKVLVNNSYQGDISMTAVSSFKPERINENEISITEKILELNIYNNSTQQFSLGMLMEPYEEETVLQNFLNRNTLTRVINNKGDVVKPYDLSELLRHKEIDEDSDELMILDAFNKNDMFSYLERPLEEGFSYVDSRKMRLATANDIADSILVNIEYKVLSITDAKTYMSYTSTLSMKVGSEVETIKMNGVLVIENSTGLPLQMRQTIFNEDASVVVLLNRDDERVPTISSLDGGLRANEYYANEWFPYEKPSSEMKFYETKEQIEKTIDSLGVMLFLRNGSYGRVELHIASQKDFAGYGEIDINSIKVHYCNKEVRELIRYKNPNSERLFPFGRGLYDEVPNSGTCNDFPVDFYEVDIDYYMPLGTKEIVLTPKDLNKPVQLLHYQAEITKWEKNKLTISGGVFARFYDAEGNEIKSGKYKLIDGYINQVANMLDKKESELTEEEYVLYSNIDGSRVIPFQYYYEMSTDVAKVKLFVPREEYVVNDKLRSMSRDEARAAFQAKEAKNQKTKDSKELSQDEIDELINSQAIIPVTKHAPPQESKVEEIEYTDVYVEETAPEELVEIVPPPAPGDEVEEELAEEEQVFIIVEEMPKFPGGEVEMRKYIANNISLPELPKEGSVSGRVYVKFVINTEGKVTKAKIVRGVHPAIDAEAIRVVESMPDWTPGTQRGKPVNVQYTVPISIHFQ